MSRGGMGYEISFAYTNFDNATMYPLIVLILLVSITINAVLSRWEKTLLRTAGHAMRRAWRARATPLLLIVGLCCSSGRSLYCWRGDVALALAARDVALHRELDRRPSRSGRHLSETHARLRGRVCAAVVIGLVSASGSASTGSRATCSSR